MKCSDGLFRRILIPLLLLLAMGVVASAQDRARLSLDGRWDLKVAGDAQSYPVQVPGSWQSQVPALRQYAGEATYSRSIEIPPQWKGERVVIHFGAVDYRTRIEVNGKQVGEHEGGYLPFEFEIQDDVRFGQSNVIALQVSDPNEKHPVVDGINVGEIPRGKQGSLYGDTSGPWQSIYLEARPSRAYIDEIRIDPDIDSDVAHVRVSLKGERAGQIKLTVQPPKGAEVVPVVTIDATDPQADIKIPHPALWSPDSPALYTLRAELVVHGAPIDACTTSFGMRKIEAKDGKILLNNKPIFLAGALDQDFYPHTEYTIPSNEFLKDQMLKAKHLGLNLLRCHIKVPDPRYLEMADRIGLLVWDEVPSWGNLTETTKRRVRQTLDGMLARDHNHPSLVIVSLTNESWGINVGDSSHRKWLIDLFDHAKSLEPHRLIVDDSWMHLKTDIEDVHGYFSIPDVSGSFVKWAKDVSTHPAWTFYDYPESRRRGFEPLMVSEFGNWGLPRVSDLAKCYGGRPWFFDLASGILQPDGVQRRFEEQGLAGTFGNLDGLADATQEQEWRALKFQIEEMRKYPSIRGYVITEFTDAQWESNGLLDMCRSPKTFYDRMHTVQDPDIVFTRTDRANFTAGERIHFDVYASHFSGRDLSRATIQWRLEQTPLHGEMRAHLASPEDGGKIGDASIVAPEVDSPKQMQLHVALLDSQGDSIATNDQPVMIFPTTAPRLPKDVIVTDHLTSDVLDRVKAGANAVICIESADMPVSRSSQKVISRDADGRWGIWCNSFVWLKPGDWFGQVPVPKLADFTFESIYPRCLIDGIDTRYWANDVLGGLFVGWIHIPEATIVQMKHGKGKLILTTFPLISGAKKDPMPWFLLSGLANYVQSDKCQPQLVCQLDPINLNHVFVQEWKKGGAIWKYTTAPPGKGWQDPTFDDSHWKEGRSAFGTLVPAGTPTTTWNTPDIYLRYAADIPGTVSDAYLRLYHDEDAQIYLNGKQILSAGGFNNSYEGHLLGPEAISAFKPGRNVIAVHCHQTGGGQCIDVGLLYGLK